jgi:hypothetical protein
VDKKVLDGQIAFVTGASSGHLASSLRKFKPAMVPRCCSWAVRPPAYISSRAFGTVSYAVTGRGSPPVLPC